MGDSEEDGEVEQGGHLGQYWRHTHTHTRTYAHTHTRTCAHMYREGDYHTHAHTQTYMEREGTHTHTYIHTGKGGSGIIRTLVQALSITCTKMVNGSSLSSSPANFTRNSDCSPFLWTSQHVTLHISHMLTDGLPGDVADGRNLPVHTNQITPLLRRISKYTKFNFSPLAFMLPHATALPTSCEY